MTSLMRHCLQSRTGGVLWAVPSAAVMGACRIFFPGGGQIQGCKNVVSLKTQVFLRDALQKSWRPFSSRHPPNTGLHCNYVQNTLQLYQGEGGKCPQNISFFSKGAPVFVEGGGRLCHGTKAQWPVKAWLFADDELSRVLFYQECKHVFLSCSFFCWHNKVST